MTAEGGELRKVYATVMDYNYLVRAWALYRSFEPFLQDKVFAFYCIDDEAADVLERLKPEKAWVVRHDDFTSPEVRAVRGSRPVNEYCWTCKPVILQHALRRAPEIDWVVFLDADTMIFGDPDEGLARAGDAQVVITPHHWTIPAFSQWEPTVGRFNSGYGAFRNTEVGRAALQWWADRCLEACPTQATPGLYSDQYYFVHLPDLFDGVYESQHHGLNAGPWNVVGRDVRAGGDGITIDGDPLLMFHYQGLKILGERFYDAYPDHVKMPPVALREIYRPYAEVVRRSFAELHAVSAPTAGAIRPKWSAPSHLLHQFRKLLAGTSNLVWV